ADFFGAVLRDDRADRVPDFVGSRVDDRLHQQLRVGNRLERRRLSPGAAARGERHEAHEKRERCDRFGHEPETYHNGNARRCTIRASRFMLSFIWDLWGAQLAVFTWLAVAFVAAILEVSIPHFGSAFVSAGAIVAAAAAYIGFSVPVQIGT